MRTMLLWLLLLALSRFVSSFTHQSRSVGDQTWNSYDWRLFVFSKRNGKPSVGRTNAPRNTRPPSEKFSRQDDKPKIEDRQKSKPKVLTTKTILGQNVIAGRNFKIETPKRFEFIGSYTSLADIPIYSLPEIAFVGRSNVGKSSLLNCITGANKNIAVQSKTPGRTQCINLFKCSDKFGEICIFTDLPGYGYAKISKEQQEKISTFVNEYLEERGALKMTTVIVDSRREEQASDRAVMQFLGEAGVPYMVVATKVDKLSKTELEKSLKTLKSAYELPVGFPIPFSAETGEGKKQVWKMIRDSILEKNVFSDDHRLVEDEEDEEEGVKLIGGRIVIDKSKDFEFDD